jgi:hypothetical protein
MEIKMHLTALSQSQSTLARLSARPRTPRRLALSLSRPAAPQCGSVWSVTETPAPEFVSNLAEQARGPSH